MNRRDIAPIDVENTFGEEEIIVSKTDLKGQITYVNDVFCKLAEMPERQALGSPHNIIRHPDMPRTIFYMLWNQIQEKKEIFAYVKNMSMSGKYYWVFAHVTPTINEADEVVGYHSSRRSVPKKDIVVISDLYKKIRDVEKDHENRKEGMEAGIQFVSNFLQQKGITYDEFVWEIGK